MLNWKSLPCRPREGGLSELHEAPHIQCSLTATVQVLCPADQRQADLKLLEAPPDAAAGKTTRLIPNAKDADDEDDESDSADESDDNEVWGWLPTLDLLLRVLDLVPLPAKEPRLAAGRLPAECRQSMWLVSGPHEDGGGSADESNDNEMGLGEQGSEWRTQ